MHIVHVVAICRFFPSIAEQSAILLKDYVAQPLIFVILFEESIAAALLIPHFLDIKVPEIFPPLKGSSERSRGPC